MGIEEESGRSIVGLDYKPKKNEVKSLVKVRWFDGYFEDFEAVETRVGNYHLWIKLVDGERWLPNHQIRWFEINDVSKEEQI